MQRNKTIDFLKGIFILFVLTLHYAFGNMNIPMTLLFRFVIQFAVPCFMFLSGYIQAKSFQKRGIENLSMAYSKDLILGRCLRFLLPYTFFFIVYFLVLRLLKVYTVGILRYGLLALFFEYLTGGKGQGSYYVPIMIQFVFLFPLIYFYILRKGFRALSGLFIINIAYEILKQAYGMGEQEYRLLIFRYLFLIGCGCHAALYPSKKLPHRYLLAFSSLALGAFFIYLFEYTSYGEHAKIFTQWQGTSVLPALFVIPILYFLVEKGNLSLRPLELIGQASFHVFLVQMLYYQIWELYYKDSFPLLPGYFLTIAICVVIGILFWKMERLLQIDKKILKALSIVCKT